MSTGSEINTYALGWMLVSIENMPSAEVKVVKVAHREEADQHGGKVSFTLPLWKYTILHIQNVFCSFKTSDFIWSDTHTQKKKENKKKTRANLCKYVSFRNFVGTV